MELEKKLGLVLRNLRKKKGLSQEKLALEAGVERNYISLLELGKSNATVKVIFKLAAVLEVSPSEILKQVEDHLR